MKKYLKPILEEIVVKTDDVLQASGIQMSEQNATFGNPDEIF